MGVVTVALGPGLSPPSDPDPTHEIRAPIRFNVTRQIEIQPLTRTDDRSIPVSADSFAKEPLDFREINPQSTSVEK